MLRFFLPQTCIHCSAHVESHRGDDSFARYLCSNCLRTFRRLETLTEDDVAEQSSRFSNLNSKTTTQAAMSFYAADSIVQHIIHHAKYHSMMKLTHMLGVELALRIPSAFSKCDLIVPVPLHRTRYGQRGYNQSTLIAKGISSIIKIPIASHSLLRRVKQTPTQTGLDHTQREENVRDAFRLHANGVEELRNKRIVLLDDIITTGATMASAATELDKGKPKHITVIAFAAVQ